MLFQRIICILLSFSLLSHPVFAQGSEEPPKDPICNCKEETGSWGMAALSVTATSFSLFSIIPPIWKLLKTKQSGDYSRAGFVIGCFGGLSWVLYSALSPDPYFKYIEALFFSIHIFQTFLVFRYFKRVAPTGPRSDDGANTGTIEFSLQGTDPA